MRSGKNYALSLEIDSLKAKKKSLIESLKAAEKQRNDSDIDAATLALDSVNADLKEKQKAFKKSENQVLIAEINRHKFIYLMLIIPLAYYFVFKYIPIWNAQIAFRDFISLKRTGITGGTWVGLRTSRHSLVHTISGILSETLLCTVLESFLSAFLCRSSLQ